MKMQSEEIEAAALALAPEARLRLTHVLVRSLESVDPETIRGLWLNEAERRETEMDEGAVNAVPGEKVLARIRAKYPK